MAFDSFALSSTSKEVNCGLSSNLRAVILDSPKRIKGEKGTRTSGEAMSTPENSIVLFIDGAVSLDVPVSPEKDTVWLTANQMALLFDKDDKTIRKHINNVFSDDELDKEVVVANFATTSRHGAVAGKTQTRMTQFYSLDVIISIGYRVKSKRGNAFRRWANSVLKQ